MVLIELLVVIAELDGCVAAVGSQEVVVQQCNDSGYAAGCWCLQLQRLFPYPQAANRELSARCRVV